MQIKYMHTYMKILKHHFQKQKACRHIYTVMHSSLHKATPSQQISARSHIHVLNMTIKLIRLILTRTVASIPILRNKIQMHDFLK